DDARSSVDALDGRFDEDLGLGTWNQHAIVDAKFAAEELRLAADVLQRLAGQPALYRGIDARGIDERLAVCQNVRKGLADKIGEEHVDIAAAIARAERINRFRRSAPGKHLRGPDCFSARASCRWR